MWALIDCEYNGWTYDAGVLRTCSKPFDLADLGNVYAHLSNHCINTRSDTYGEYEATNEMFYAEFERLLDGARGAGALRATVLPQVDAIVAHCFDAARESVEVRWRGTYGYVSGHRSFQLFGFDFMVTDALDVKLIEINSSPAVAEELLPQFARDLKARAIDAALEPGDAPPAPLALGAKRDGFTLVYRAPRYDDAALATDAPPPAAEAAANEPEGALPPPAATRDDDAPCSS